MVCALVCCIAVLAIVQVSCANIARLNSLLQLRGGLVPQADEDGGGYYEQFQLDYGCEDNVRIAGSMRGLIRSGKLSSLPESDPFLKWLNDKLEKGAEAPDGRVKPFYAADFGSKADLKKGEKPKIIIVNRKLSADKAGVLKPGSPEVDVEIRHVWQPWLSKKCDFVVRYIVPNRTNILELMESKNRFRSELRLTKNKNGKIQEAAATMIFKPSYLRRLVGNRDVVIKRKLEASKLFD
mmetsp:Transcript_22054/g.36948  ORF Transcript_22054/g.36948 Transcript_22054/m.36948 type:complete len:238 (+) Transcript_22054:75-788(+)